MTDLKALARQLAREFDPTPGDGAPVTVEATLQGGRLADVEPEDVRWLWPGRIPFGKLTVLDGDPGLGKSLLTLDLAARLSRGTDLPDGTPLEAGTSVILTAEDGLADTVRPRLDAMRADALNVYGFTAALLNGNGAAPITLPDHLELLRRKVKELGARFVVIDPLMAYLSSDVNSRVDHDVRRVLSPVAEFAEDTGAAILVVRHLNKATGGSAVYRGGGSIGIIGAARSGLLVAADPDDETARVLAVVKSNLCKQAPSLKFTVESAGTAAFIKWGGESAHTANALVALGVTGEERDALTEAKDFLLTELRDKDGKDLARPATEMQMRARKAGIAEITLRRARIALRVRCTRTGFGSAGEWSWSLPSDIGAQETPKMVTKNGDQQRVSVSKYGEPDPGGAAPTCPKGHPLVGKFCPACNREPYLTALAAEAEPDFEIME